MGYTIKEQKALRTKNGTEIVETDKVVLPDVEAIKFWLTNRGKNRWQNKVQNDLNVRPVVKRKTKRFDGSNSD